MRLSNAILPVIGRRGVAVPNYDPASITPGIFHVSFTGSMSIASVLLHYPLTRPPRMILRLTLSPGRNRKFPPCSFRKLHARTLPARPHATTLGNYWQQCTTGYARCQEETIGGPRLVADTGDYGWSQSRCPDSR